MRVCPSCQSRFDGGETFCPHDGTKLVDARELSPGELTGSKLDDIVRLDKLAYSDAFAERYTGRLLESRRAVYVTVFNQSFKVDPSATKRVETARAKVGSPMPAQINTLLQTHFDKAVPYLIESEPRGPSVRTLLDEKRSLAWDEAVRITANLARAMQWLHEQGVPHCSFHPTSIFVTKLQAGQVVVGDWALEALFPPDSAQRLVEEDPSAFAGYVDYMAPEIARATDKADIRSAVYALGCVLYEMVLGKVPLPGKSPAEVLKRHQHEKPVRLSIAVGGGDLPAQLDDILEMMLAKDPDKRFQSPAAAVAALSNLVADSADALAPPLERAGETDIDDLYRTIDMDRVDREEIERHNQNALKPTLDLEQAPAAPAVLATGGAVSGVSATADVDETSPDGAVDSATKRSTGQYNKPAAVLSRDDGTDEAFEPDAITRPTTPVPQEEEESKKTLMFGAMNALTAPPAEDEDEDDGRKKTLLNFSSNTTGPPAKLSRKQKKLAKQGPPNGAVPPAASASAPTDKTIKLNIDPAAIEREARESGPKQGPPAGALPPAATGSSPALVVESEPAPPETVEAESDESVSPTVPDGMPNIGFITPDRSTDGTREIDRSNWFSGNTEDVWENSLAQEELQKSERRNKTIVIGLVVALALGALGLVAYFEVASVEEPEVVAEVVKPVEPVKPAIDLAEIKSAFDEALAAGRIVEPLGNSAITHLESLKRHGPQDPLFEEARVAFVDAARTAAKEADGKGDLRSARSLAGYASQFAPDDEELTAMSADLNARFTGAATAPPVDADAGATAGDAGLPDMGTEAVEPPEVAVAPDPPKQPDKPSKPVEKKPKVTKEKPPKKWDSGDAETLAREARAAHTSGNLDQARKLYSDALEIDPKSTTALAGLGKVYFDKANYREAVKYQTKAVRYAPQRNDYRISLGQSYYRLGKYEEAVSVWEKVLARDPNNGTAKQYVELAKRKLGR